MAASHHQPQQNPTRQADGLTDQGSSFRRRQDATQVQVKRLLQQQPDSGSTVHAVTTPPINLMLQLWRKANMGWIAKTHGAGLGACTL
jgi:mevalonate kinase